MYILLYLNFNRKTNNNQTFGSWHIFLLCVSFILHPHWNLDGDLEVPGILNYPPVTKIKFTGKTWYFKTWNPLWSCFKKIKAIFKINSEHQWALIFISPEDASNGSIQWISGHFWKPKKNQSTRVHKSMSEMSVISSCHLLEDLWFRSTEKLSSLQTSISCL